jgi:hypothetical protein
MFINKRREIVGVKVDNKLAIVRIASSGAPIIGNTNFLKLT